MAKKSSFWKDFKAFITKGNIIDMAVGVVIGGAFGKIITGLVNYIINPFIGIFMGEGNSLETIKTVIHEAVIDAETGEETAAEVAILWGAWIQTILDFLITALCIFVVLRLIMKVKALMDEEKIKAEEAKAAAEKEAADKAAAELAAKQERLNQSMLNQEKLLEEIKVLLEKK